MKPPRVVIVIQARTGSTRLPNKVLADLGGRPVVRHLIDTATQVPNVDQVILAVPFGDDALVTLGADSGITVITGPGDDVLGRFQRAARHSAADAVVRLTADCPLLDGQVLTSTISDYLATPVDYLTVEGYPRGTADIEIASREALDRIDRSAADDFHREHVFTYVGDNPNQFSIRVLRPSGDQSRSDLRVCIDEQSDLEMVRELHARLGGRPPDVATVIAILDRDPALVAVNADVAQVSHNAAADLAR